MPKALYRPEHVDAALDRLEEADDAALERLVDVANPRDADYVPSEALVRLLRRARVESAPRTERAVFRALHARVQRFARRRYCGLSEADREDLAQTLCMAVAIAVESPTLDFWEITFTRMLERAAADAYQKHFAPQDMAPGLEAARMAEESDGGVTATELSERTLLMAFAEKVLTVDERNLFHLMFVAGLPIKSRKATRDLVRATGRPEGTLAEIKARIVDKLERASQEVETP